MKKEEPIFLGWKHYPTKWDVVLEVFRKYFIPHFGECIEINGKLSNFPKFEKMQMNKTIHFCVKELRIMHPAVSIK